MSTSSLLVAFVILITLAIGGLGVRGFLRKAASRAAEDSGLAASTATPLVADGAATPDTARDPRVARVSEAYANGEIDERMLTTAARVLGIEKAEARRRLEGAANAEGVVPAGEREKQRAQTRAKNRKKNKQAKRSRQANRR